MFIRKARDNNNYQLLQNINVPATYALIKKFY